MNKNKKKAMLTALLVSLVLLVLAVAGTLLFDYYMEYIQFDMVGMIIGHAIGFLLLFAIIYKYEIKDDSEASVNKNTTENHNIY